MSAAECPRCGWNCTSPTDAARPLPRAAHDSAVPADEITLLEDQVRRLDEEILRLNEDRATILRKINSARSATRHLPPEILSTIFQFVSPPFDFVPPFSSNDFRKEKEPCVYDKAFQCDMAAVSHVWRQAAFSTPQLWTSLSLRVHPSFTNASLSLFNQFSQKMPHLSMSIDLDFRDDEIPWPDDDDECLLLMEPIQKAIFVEHADRIQSLRLVEPPSEWLLQVKSLSRCDTLVVIWPSHDQDPGPLDLTELPYLRHVVLVHPWYTFSLPQSRITTLHLRGVSCTICLELLMNCPNLVEFESYSPSCLREQHHVAPVKVNGPITLEQIEYLTWSVSYCSCLPSIRRCIGYLRFSKLRALQWCNEDCWYASSDERDQYHGVFSNLPTTLSSLTFYHFTDPTRQSILKEILFSIPHLCQLHFIKCSIECVAAVIKAIGRSYVPSSRSSPNQVFLPHLSELSLASFVRGLDGHIFVDMLEALHASGKNPKQFHLVLRSTTSWNIDSLSRMRALVAFGFSVEGV